MIVNIILTSLMGFDINTYYLYNTPQLRITSKFLDRVEIPNICSATLICDTTDVRNGRAHRGRPVMRFILKASDDTLDEEVSVELDKAVQTLVAETLNEGDVKVINFTMTHLRRIDDVLKEEFDELMPTGEETWSGVAGGGASVPYLVSALFAYGNNAARNFLREVLCTTMEIDPRNHIFVAACDEPVGGSRPIFYYFGLLVTQDAVEGGRFVILSNGQPRVVRPEHLRSQW